MENLQGRCQNSDTNMRTRSSTMSINSSRPSFNRKKPGVVVRTMSKNVRTNFHHSPTVLTKDKTTARQINNNSLTEIIKARVTNSEHRSMPGLWICTRQIDDREIRTVGGIRTTQTRSGIVEGWRRSRTRKIETTILVLHHCPRKRTSAADPHRHWRP